MLSKMGDCRLRLAVGVIGPGAIGGTFLRQLQAQRNTLRERHAIYARVVGITGSKRMLLDPAGIDLANWRHPYEQSSTAADLEQFFVNVRDTQDYANHIFVDNTASDAVPEHYNRWLEAGCHVVTPNKKYGSGPLERYRMGQEIRHATGSQFLYEATVGAGLPVISTLQSLIETGDEIHTIEGVFSGTLSYIFNQVSKDMRFSEVVSKAKAMGYTEPDPRDDLAGMDVARKVVVLARECGIGIELGDLEIQSLVPEQLQSIPDVESFMEELPNYDEDMLAQIMAAESAHEVLRYVGVINVREQKCEVALRRYPRQHALGGLNGTDNMIIFKTERYNEQPLVIQGPGAGADVTAMGVFSDFLSIAKRLKH